MTPEQRQHVLQQAGWNVLHLDPVDIDYDLLTDIPLRAFHPTVSAEGADAATQPTREPPLAELAAKLYGPARYVVCTKGRAAEMALVHALRQKFGKPELTIVTHGLFRTTQHALHRWGHGKLEIAPPARAVGTADVDLDWLAQRLQAGGVDVVYLEPCNNTLAGWSLSLENVTAVRALCDMHHALLVLDCPRLLSNLVALGLALSAAADYMALADAFTVSSSKESLTPYGALVGLRDAELERSVFAYCADEGTLLEPLDAKVRLASGMRRIHVDPTPLYERRQLLVRLADGLREAGVHVIDPIGGHALYLPVPPELIDADPLRLRALDAWLYLVAGVRALAFPNPILKRVIIRLAMPLARFHAPDMDRIAYGVGQFFARASEAPSLTVVDAGLQPMLGRFTTK